MAIIEEVKFPDGCPVTTKSGSDALTADKIKSANFSLFFPVSSDK